jgi:DNA-binding transcriptional regulator GbsR (MarR family)
MEQETLFTASKWEILKLLESTPLSPIELASLSRTSVANVSQQLRLLEMAGLVTSTRVPNRERGQPRILYRLAGDSCYFISTSTNFVNKKQRAMSIHNKIILRIWLSADKQEHYFLEKGFWQIDQYLPKLQALGVTASGDTITFSLVTEQSLGEMSPVTLTGPDGSSRKVVFNTVSPEKIPAGTTVLYDPQKILDAK